MRTDGMQVVSTEVSKRWTSEQNHDPDLISALFSAELEDMGNNNYRLHSWQFNQIVFSNGDLLETIVAVFSKVDCLLARKPL